jgi:hypothetical protein
MAGADRLGDEIEGRAYGRGDVLDQDVDPIAERVEPRAPRRVLEVEDEARLVRVAEEIGQRPLRRDGLTGVSAARLDLHHLGTQVGEDPAGQRPAEVGEIEDAEMSERPGHSGRCHHVTG